MKADPEVEAVAKQLLRSYCPGSWPLAWKVATEETRNGWRKTAIRIIRTLDRVRGIGHTR